MSNSIQDLLKDRSKMLTAVRTFFAERQVIEVDCPILSTHASVDAHIDLIPAIFSGEIPVYLHSSPEYGMKQLLCAGSGDIYQLSHVFRDGEMGDRHHPEFMMIEWYRLGFSFEEMIQETADICCLFIGQQPLEHLSYREAFIRYLQIDPFLVSDDDLFTLVRTLNLDYQGIESEGRHALLNALVGGVIECRLGTHGLTALAYYPASQAALAQTKIIEGAHVAERFELYYKGMELSNGYHELGNAQEQEQRLEEANLERMRCGKNTLPIDHDFIHALKIGLPDCCGVAVGFDRLMMLRHQTCKIEDIISLNKLIIKK